MALIGLCLFAWVFVVGLQRVIKRWNSAPERYVYEEYINDEGEKCLRTVDMKDLSYKDFGDD